MSADLLRRAAGRLRDHVEACVIHGPWEYRDCRADADSYPWIVWAPKSRCSAGTGFAPGTAQYVALMHPPVALALAGWLDATAMTISDWTEAVGGERDGDLTETDVAAIAVARAILREAPDAP